MGSKDSALTKEACLATIAVPKDGSSVVLHHPVVAAIFQKE